MEALNLGTRVVNAWLIPGKSGFVLIDTGYAGGFPRFLRKLKKAGIEPADIQLVFLTHAHDDHAGFLNEVLSATEARVILHPKAVEGLQRGQNSFEGGCSGRLAYWFCLLLAALGKGEHRYPPIRPEYLDRLIPVGSEEFRAMELPFQVLETPGHTADHISLLTEGTLFCGDAAMNGFPSRRRTTIWIEDLRLFKQSWQTMLKAGPKVICPAHGKPFPASDLEKFLPFLDRVILFPLRPR